MANDKPYCPAESVYDDLARAKVDEQEKHQHAIKYFYRSVRAEKNRSFGALEQFITRDEADK